MIFKLQENVPEYYVDKSRDFQLFSRIFDSAYNSTQFSIDSISNISNTALIDSRLLPLLAYKLGFFDELNLSEQNQRLLLMSLPTIFRAKGSKEALENVIYLYCRMYGVTGKLSEVGDGIIKLIFDDDVQDQEWLFQLITYIIPTGYYLAQVVATEDNIETTVNVNTNSKNKTFKQKDITFKLTFEETPNNNIRQTVLTLVRD